MSNICHIYMKCHYVKILGVTIASQIDYCDTITIAEIPIAILLLLQDAIALHCTYYWIQLLYSESLLFCIKISVFHINSCLKSII